MRDVNYRLDVQQINCGKSCMDRGKDQENYPKKWSSGRGFKGSRGQGVKGPRGQAPSLHDMLSAILLSLYNFVALSRLLEPLNPRILFVCPMPSALLVLRSPAQGGTKDGCALRFLIYAAFFSSSFMFGMVANTGNSK